MQSLCLVMEKKKPPFEKQKVRWMGLGPKWGKRGSQGSV